MCECHKKHIRLPERSAWLQFFPPADTTSPVTTDLDVSLLHLDRSILDAFLITTDSIPLSPMLTASPTHTTLEQKKLLAKTMHVFAWLFIIYAAFNLLAIVDYSIIDYIVKKDDQTFTEFIFFQFSGRAMTEFWPFVGLAMLFEWISASIRAGIK